ncbi:hypothetical protein JCM19046_4457 [Bacillus sp. JCM 19046]|nr:hypothetical protein JCM19045_3188 [Bacillus sp. JCM 19045]GAF19779.1 hypothetical protein JCM19046_4457 [Bacillus sp. JCM 19046]
MTVRYKGTHTKLHLKENTIVLTHNRTRQKLTSVRAVVEIAIDEIEEIIMEKQGLVQSGYCFFRRKGVQTDHATHMALRTSEYAVMLSKRQYKSFLKLKAAVEEMQENMVILDAFDKQAKQLLADPEHSITFAAHSGEVEIQAHAVSLHYNRKHNGAKGSLTINLNDILQVLVHMPTTEKGAFIVQYMGFQPAVHSRKEPANELSIKSANNYNYLQEAREIIHKLQDLQKES